MKLLLVIYSGNQPQLVPELLDRHEVGGYTEFAHAHGAGATGKRAASRAWPGDASVFFSVVPSTSIDALVAALHQTADRLQPGERLHAAVLPTETFF